jgi:lysylphosphatidylglycerol synthetase-like protein (DUF2156 family)
MYAGIRFESIWYLVAAIWAYGGVLLRHVEKSGFNWQYPRYTNATFACLLLLCLTLAVVIVNKIRARRSQIPRRSRRKYQASRDV